MSAKKTLKKYVGVAKWRRIFAWVCFAVTVASIVMFTAFQKTSDKNEAVPFDPVSSKRSEYVYLDVVGVSDGAYKEMNNNSDTTYYAAIDEDGNYYTLVTSSVNDITVASLKAQKDYWNDDDENTAMPEAVRIYGTPTKLSSGGRKKLAECWDISEDKFVEFFGDRYLYVNVSPADNSNDVWGVVAVLAGLCWLIIAIMNAAVNGRMNKSIKALKASGELEAAAQELNAEGTVDVANENGRASEHYLFSHGNGTILRYSDIVWVYPRVTRRYRSVARGSYGAGISANLVANTMSRKNINVMALNVAIYLQEAEQVISVIAQHNPNVLVGMSKDNSNKYKELRRSAK